MTSELFEVVYCDESCRVVVIVGEATPLLLISAATAARIAGLLSAMHGHDRRSGGVLGATAEGELISVVESLIAKLGREQIEREADTETDPERKSAALDLRDAMRALERMNSKGSGSNGKPGGRKPGGNRTKPGTDPE